MPRSLAKVYLAMAGVISAVPVAIAANGKHRLVSRSPIALCLACCTCSFIIDCTGVTVKARLRPVKGSVIQEGRLRAKGNSPRHKRLKRFRGRGDGGLGGGGGAKREGERGGC